ncbi:MAG: hypothetical protein WAM14_15295 [Candidatus Nitrosopolaris sp.]
MIIYDDPDLRYNIESFLLQSKSSLDVFAQLIAYCFSAEITSYGTNGGEPFKKVS